MSVLIEEFKKEHSEIIKALKEVEELGVLTKEGHTKLMSLLPDLLDHLWREDVRLYPDLIKESKHNKKLKEVLSLIVDDIGAIREELLIFMIKYAEGDIINSTFQREYELLFAFLSKRIWYEENVLYDEYEKLNKL